MGAVTQFDGTFDPGGEGGLMGIALEPRLQRGTDRRVFVCYSTTTDNRVARFDLELLGPPPTTRHQQLDTHRHRPPARRVPRRLPGAVPARHRRAVREHGRRGHRHRAAVDHRARRQDPAHRHERRAVAGQRVRLALVHPRPPQPARSGVPARVERPVLGRARTRRQRRGQQARQRRERRVEPEQRRRQLRPVEADDRLRARARQHHDPGLAVGWCHRRAVGRHVPLGRAVEGLGRRARRRVPRRQPDGRPAPPRHASERRRHRAHRAPGHRARRGRAPARRGAGPRRQPLRRHRRQQRCRRDLEGRAPPDRRSSCVAQHDSRRRRSVGTGGG